jgi:hypothetical protein
MAEVKNELSEQIRLEPKVADSKLVPPETDPVQPLISGSRARALLVGKSEPDISA